MTIRGDSGEVVQLPPVLEDELPDQPGQLGSVYPLEFSSADPTEAGQVGFLLLARSRPQRRGGV